MPPVASAPADSPSSSCIGASYLAAVSVATKKREIHDQTSTILTVCVPYSKRVMGHFGQDPFRPEKTWTFQQKHPFRPNHIDVSAKKAGQNILNFTESGIISRGNHRINCPFSSHANITLQLHIVSLKLIGNSTDHDNSKIVQMLARRAF